jgi:hypothetical protein
MLNWEAFTVEVLSPGGVLPPAWRGGWTIQAMLAQGRGDGAGVAARQAAPAPIGCIDE